MRKECQAQMQKFWYPPYKFMTIPAIEYFGVAGTKLPLIQKLEKQDRYNKK